MSRKPARKPTKPQHYPFIGGLVIHLKEEERKQKEVEATLENMKQLISGKEGSKNAQSTQGKNTIQ